LALGLSPQSESQPERLASLGGGGEEWEVVGNWMVVGGRSAARAQESKLRVFEGSQKCLQRQGDPFADGARGFVRFIL